MTGKPALVEQVAFKAMLMAAHWPDLEEGVSEYRLVKHAWDAGKDFARQPLTARVAELEAGLRPFADCSELFDQDRSDDQLAEFHLPIGHYRRAARALLGDTK